MIHGMGGFGKTVLAAEAVRDATILREVFPGNHNCDNCGHALMYNFALNTVSVISKWLSV